MSAKVAELAKSAITALIRPWHAAEKAGHAAIDQLVTWLPPDQRIRYERLCAQVSQAPVALVAREIGSREHLEAALSMATALFKEQGISVEELVRLRLDRDQAVAEQVRRFSTRRESADEPEASICRQYVIPALIDALYREPEALAEMDLAFKRAALNNLGKIDQLPEATVDAFRKLASSALLRDPVERWHSGLANSSLLQAEFGIVPFEPREELVHGALAWAEVPEPVGIRLYVGPGGMGKTRLMIHVCEQLPASWRAGFLGAFVQNPPSWLIPQMFDTRQPVFVVVDYAENRRRDVGVLLEHAFRAPIGARIRIALLARGEADWWDELRRSSGLAHALLAGRQTELPIPVGVITMDRYAREEIFRNAVVAFADRLGTPRGQVSLLPDLSGEHFGSILMIHVAALAALEGKSLGTAPALLDYILDREERGWEQSLTGPKLANLDVDDVRQAMALVTFHGGVRGMGKARQLLWRAPRLRGVPQGVIEQLARLLSRLYPDLDRPHYSRELRIAPLRPDVLGEHLIGRALERDPALLEAVFGG